MAAKPTMEIRPEGLGLHWCHVWDNALASMKAQGTWDRDLRPLLDEYVFALVAAEEARDAEEATRWDRHVKRASVLADQLALTPRGRKVVGVGDSSEVEDPLARFATPSDELAVKRQGRAG